MSDTTVPTRTQVFEALSSDANNGKTAREVAEATGIKYSTVTENLRTMESDGYVRKEKSGRQTTWTRVENPGGPGDQRRDASATGAVVVDEVAEDTGPVPVRTDAAPSETAVDASEALSGTTTPADPDSAVSGDVVASDGPTAAVTPTLETAASVADVAAAMEAVRPIPDPPATPERKTRTPRESGPAREVRNDFGSGGLQGEMLRYMDEAGVDDDGVPKVFGPYDLATALKAHASSVAYSLKRTTVKGQTVRVSAEGEKPRYRLVTKDEANAAAGA